MRRASFLVSKVLPEIAPTGRFIALFLVLPLFLLGLTGVEEKCHGRQWQCEPEDDGGDEEVPPCIDCSAGGPGRPSAGAPCPATTANPIHLRRGSVLEAVTDLRLAGPAFSWSHSRNYDSLSVATDGSSRTTASGLRWRDGGVGPYLLKIGDDVALFTGASSKRTFIGAALTPPNDYNATLEGPELDGDQVYTLTEIDSGNVWIFDGAFLSQGSRGALLKRTTRESQAAAAAAGPQVEPNGTTYTYNDDGFVSQITTADPQAWCVGYSYNGGGVEAGRLNMIEIKNGLGVVIKKAEYLYFGTANSPSISLGGNGDLAQVKVSELASDGIAWDVRTTQYRYFKSVDIDGRAHQLKCVIESDAIERILASDNELNFPEDIMKEDDDFAMDEGELLDTYYSRSFTYYTDPQGLNTDVKIVTSWAPEMENLSTKYGGTDLNEYDAASFGRVKSERVNGGCASCGGGSSAGGVKRTYYYMDLNGGESSISSDVIRLVIEDTQDANGNDVSRKIIGLNNNGSALRTVVIKDPMVQPLSAWCSSTTVNSDLRITRETMPSAHKMVVSNADLMMFLDPTGGSNGSNDSATVSSDSGIVYYYEYDDTSYGDGKRRTGKLVRQGAGDDKRFYLSATNYGNGTNDKPTRLPVARYTYRLQTEARDAGIKTMIQYEFYDTADTQTKKIITTLPAISSDQNGSNEPTQTYQYFDEEGRLRWTKDGEGYVNYTSYHPETGGVAYRMSDVGTSSDINSGSAGKWIPWNGTAGLTREPDLHAAIAQVTKTEYDAQGRVVKTIDASNAQHIVRYFHDGVARYPFVVGNSATLPVQVQRIDNAGRVIETFSVKPSAMDINALALPSNSSDYVTRTVYNYDEITGQKKSEDRYYDIAKNKYHRTGYLYDPMGRNAVTTQLVVSQASSPLGLLDNLRRAIGFPSGLLTSYLYAPTRRKAVSRLQDGSSDYEYQVSLRVFDHLGRAIESRSGVLTLAPESYADAFNNASLVKRSTTVYDDDDDDDIGDVGDGRVTSRKTYYGSGTNEFLKVQPQYTWRGFVRGNLRMNGTTAYGPYSLRDVDWLGRATDTANFTNAPSNWATFLTDDDDYVATTPFRHNWTQTKYDDLGRVYRTLRCVGRVSNKHFKHDNYYDRNSRQVGSQQAYGMGRETAYDGLGRSFQTRVLTDLEPAQYDTLGKFQYRDPQPTPSLSSTGGNDKVIAMQHSIYDDTDGGRMVGSHSFEAHHDDTDGIDFSNNDDYVRVTNYTWFDDMGRATATANYGSGNGTGVNQWKYTSVPTRAATAPGSSSDAVPVSRVTYHADTGRAEVTTDPLARKTKTFWDDFGRQIFIAENYMDFDPSNISSTVGGGADNDEDRVTGTTYNELGGVVTQTAYNAGESDQVTTNLYGDDVDASRITTTAYPDSGQMVFTYHLDGSRDTTTDQRGVVHTYEYDTERRLKLDRATTIPVGVDSTVKSIKRTYDDMGRVQNVTSHSNDDGTGTPVNLIGNNYSHLGQLFFQAQSRTSPPEYGGPLYVYDTSDIGDVYDDGLRLQDVTNHPSGNLTVHRDYGPSGGLDDLMSRVYRLRKNNSTGTVLAEYQRTGSGRLAQIDYPEIDIRNSHHANDSDGVYEGFDRFGRIIDQSWYKYTATTGDKDHFNYTYDRTGNRLTKDIAASLFAANYLDQKLVFDGLDRLTKFEEGALSGANITSRRYLQQWEQDQLGNWTNFKELNDYVQAPEGSVGNTDQDREHNAANEISSIDSESNHIAHDATGNMTKVTKPSNFSSHYDLKYDAWNRLVEVKDGATVVQANQYDGLNRRIIRDETGTGGDKILFYYNGQQVIEEKKVVAGAVVAAPLNQYVYHPHYVDAVVFRDYDANTNGTSVRHYYQHDATFNVTALVDDNGSVVERYHYGPYGKVSVLDENFSADADGKSDVANEYMFTGRRLDSTGLYYFRARYYHAQLGRFISRDPLGYVDGMSQYRAYFVPGAMDPEGLQDCSECEDGNHSVSDDFKRTCCVEDIEIIKILKKPTSIYINHWLQLDGEGWGHAAIRMPNGQIRGFWPKFRADVFNGFQPGEMRNESGTEGEFSVVEEYEACPDSIEAMNTWLVKMVLAIQINKQNPWGGKVGETYQSFNGPDGRNCIGFVYSGIEAAGGTPPYPPTTVCLPVR